LEQFGGTQHFRQITNFQFLQFSGGKIITLLGDGVISEAARQTGINDSQQRRTGAADSSKEKKTGVGGGSVTS
jgi:hypothetical protein